MSELQSELNRDIFIDDKAINYYSSSTKVKARNFLTNVSYNRITAIDYKNRSFVIDCFTFMVLYLNPFYLERKFETSTEREFVNVLWCFLMPSSLYNFINQNKNMTMLNKIKIKYVDVKKLMLEFVQCDEGNVNVLASYLEKNGILYQFLYGNLFQKCFSRIDDYGVRAKMLFNTYYQNFMLQKNVINWQSNNLIDIKEEEVMEEAAAAEESPLNMTTLDEEEEKRSKTTTTTTAITTTAAAVPKPKNKKRKINNTEAKSQKRALKKQKLIEQLNENTDKMKKLKKKIN